MKVLNAHYFYFDLKWQQCNCPESADRESLYFIIFSGNALVHLNSSIIQHWIAIRMAEVVSQSIRVS